MKFQNALNNISDIDTNSVYQAKEIFSHIAKPLKGFGIIEENFIKIAGMQHNKNIDISKKAVVIMCSDNGVVAQSVTQTTQDVTAIVAEQMAMNNTSICKIAQICKADVIPVDIGIAKDVHNQNIIKRKIAYGTKDISVEAAMTREQAVKAIEVGINLVKELKNKGYGIIITGEMGIGNTTTSSACTAVLLQKNVEEVTGRGAGLSTEGLLNKIKVIKKAIKINKPDKNDAIDVISKVGGFDICGMAGLFIGGAVFKIPIVIDGFISALAALVAYIICPKCKNYMIASHCSKEPACLLILEKIGLKPVLFAEMALGEGTGGLAVMPLYDMVSKMYYEMPKFSDMNIKEYKYLD